jgi:hypothetical protein
VAGTITRECVFRFAMSKSDEYRESAAECERMAGIATDPREKVTWLRMAAHWLRLIPKSEVSAREKFEVRAKTQRTGQSQSAAQH